LVYKHLISSRAASVPPGLAETLAAIPEDQKQLVITVISMTPDQILALPTQERATYVQIVSSGIHGSFGSFWCGSFLSFFFCRGLRLVFRPRERGLLCTSSTCRAAIFSLKPEVDFGFAGLSRLSR
jgi:hypothetical protein